MLTKHLHSCVRYLLLLFGCAVLILIAPITLACAHTHKACKHT